MTEQNPENISKETAPEEAAANETPQSETQQSGIQEIFDSLEAKTETSMSRGEILTGGETPKAEVEPPPLKISCHKCQQKLDVASLEPFSKFDCPSCGSELIVPKWFDNYLLEEHGGTGGMATVYRALDLALDREVAIKILNHEVASKKERSELFLHEARTAATINHYAVIPIYTCGEFNNMPYIVMQFMAGGSLENVIKVFENKIPIKDVAKWMRDVSEGLDSAKRHGIVHHDIKPGNIMLDADGNAKIGDFGIAQAVNDTRTNKIFEITKGWVSPHYVSPEKVINGKEDFRGDIYSLGATFYHLLTGETPFNHDNMDELIRMRLRQKPVPPSKLRPEIPEELSKLVMSMLNMEQENRPGYREIVKTLNTIMKSDFSNVETQIKIAATKKLREAAQKRAAEATSKKKGLGAMSLLAGAAALALLAGAGWYLNSTGQLDAVKAMIAGAKTQRLPPDHFPEISEAFAKGDSAKAAELARKALEEGGADMEKRRQAAIQLALADFLCMNKKARENCAFIAERLAAAKVGDDDPAMAIIRYLEKPEISPEALKLRLVDERDLQIIGLLTILARNIHDKKPEEALSESFCEYYDKTREYPENYWGNAWGRRLEAWAKSIRDQEGAPESLEPLFASILKRKAQPAQAAASGETQVALDSVDENWLRERRQFQSERPTMSQLAKARTVPGEYIEKVPEDKRAAEQSRLVEITKIREYLADKLRSIPYESDSIKLGDGRSLKGSLSGNREKLRLASEDGASRTFGWEELAPEEFSNMLAELIKLRTAAASKGVIAKARADALNSADHYRLAIVADWQGRFADAARHARDAVKTDERTKADIQRNLLN